MLIILCLGLAWLSPFFLLNKHLRMILLQPTSAIFDTSDSNGGGTKPTVFHTQALGEAARGSQCPSGVGTIITTLFPPKI